MSNRAPSSLTVPPRYWRKVVAAATGISLAFAASGLAPQWVGAAAVLICLGLLVESFGRDVVWQFRQRHAEFVVVPRRTESAAEPYQG